MNIFRGDVIDLQEMWYKLIGPKEAMSFMQQHADRNSFAGECIS
jgi:hypothetical protein